MFDEEGNKLKQDDYIPIISLGTQQYNSFVKKIGGKYEDYKDGAILIDNCISYNSEGKKVEQNIYNWKKGDVIEGKVSIPFSGENEQKNNEYITESKTG